MQRSSDYGTAFILSYQLPRLASTFLLLFLSYLICFLVNICLTRHTLLCRITLPQPVHNVPIRRVQVYGARCAPSASRISENFSEKKHFRDASPIVCRPVSPLSLQKLIAFLPSFSSIAYFISILF